MFITEKYLLDYDTCYIERSRRISNPAGRSRRISNSAGRLLCVTSFELLSRLQNPDVRTLGRFGTAQSNTPIVWLLARLTWVAHCGWNNIQVNNIIHIANRFPLYWIYYCFRSTACCKLQYFFCLESITMCFMLALPLPGNPCKTNGILETWSNCRFMSLSYLLLLDANPWYYNDVIMSKIASQITGVSIVYLTVSSGAHQRKYPRHWPVSGEFTGDRWLMGKHVVAIKHQSPRDALYLKKLAEWPRGLVGHG